MNYEKDFYESGEYSNIAVSSQGGLYGKLFHSLTEKRLSKNHYSNVLEVGGLNGQHLNYIKHTYDKYTISDIIPATSFIENPKVKFKLDNIEDSSFANEEFDRVILTCVLHHLVYPQSALKELLRITKTGGLISILLPIDPHWPYKLTIELTSIRKAKKIGLLYEARKNRALGHRNHYDSLKWQILDAFQDHSIRRIFWPLPPLRKMFNLFEIYQIIK